MTDPPMYNIASDVTCHSLAIVRSLSLPGCDYGLFSPGKYGQGCKYGQIAYNSHVQEHRSLTKKCFISVFKSVHSALLHPYTS